MSNTEKDDWRERIESEIRDKKNELSGVNSEIAKYEKIRDELQKGESSVNTYISTLNSSVNEVIDSYDVKGGTAWAGVRSTVASQEITFIKNKESDYKTEVDDLHSKILKALESVNMTLARLYSRRASLERKIQELYNLLY